MLSDKKSAMYMTTLLLLYVTSLILGPLASLQGQGAQLGSPEQFSGNVNTNPPSLPRLQFRSREQYQVIKWEYDVTVRGYQSNQNMFLWLHYVQQSGVYFDNKRRCIDNSQHLSTFDQRDPRLVKLAVQRNTFECYSTLSGGQSELHCNGSIKIAAPQPMTWQARIAPHCNVNSTTQPMEVNYRISLYNESVECRDARQLTLLTLPEYFRQEVVSNFSTKFYPYFSEVNMLGFDNNAIYLYSQLFPFLQSVQCYKFLIELIVRLILPQCSDGRVIYHCKEMCQEFLNACNGTAEQGVLEYVQGCNVLINKPNTSESSQPQCEYRPVVCPRFEIDNGNIKTESREIVAGTNVHVQCDSGYKLGGPDIARCTYSANWTDIEKKPFSALCHKLPASRVPLIVSLCVVGGVIILLLSVSFYVYGRWRYEVFILVHKYASCLLCCSRFKGAANNKFYHAFVAFHQSDETFVRDEVQSPLEGAGYRLFVDYRDGMPGEAPLRYSAEAIAQSQRVILVLSNSFLGDSQCTFLLDQAYYQTLEGDSFQVILLLMEPARTLKHVPRFLRSYLRTVKAINKEDTMFELKLNHAMPQLEVLSLDRQVSVEGVVLQEGVY